MPELSLMPPTYLGELDDVVERFPWPVQRPLATVDGILLRHLLGSHRVLLNDGYLAAEPVLRAMAADPDSLLSRMLAAGFLQLLSAGNRPSSSIERRAAGGVVSHAARIAAPEWSEVATLLDRFTPQPWPTVDLTRGFGTLALRAAGVNERDAASGVPGTPDPRAQQLIRLAHQLRNHPFAPRTQMESQLAAAVAARDIDQAAGDEAMALGNIIYHLNFAAALALDIRDGAAASTWLGPDTWRLICVAPVSTPHVHPVLPAAIAHRAIPALVDILADPASDLARARLAFLETPMRMVSQENYRSALGLFADSEGTAVATAWSLHPGDAAQRPVLACWSAGSTGDAEANPLGSIFLSQEQARAILEL
jgi:hypothetical protein